MGRGPGVQYLDRLEARALNALEEPLARAQEDRHAMVRALSRHPYMVVDQSALRGGPFTVKQSI